MPVIASDLKGERYLLAYAVHRESANYEQLLSLFLNAFVLKRDFGMLGHVEKIRCLQMVIAGRDSSIDALPGTPGLSY